MLGSYRQGEPFSGSTVFFNGVQYDVTEDQMGVRRNVLFVKPV